MEIRELKDIDGFKKRALLYEGVHLVLFDQQAFLPWRQAPLPWRSELLAFDSVTNQLLWKLTPREGVEKDFIIDVWPRDGNLLASTWSCFTYTLDRRTGKVLDCVFTK